MRGLREASTRKRTLAPPSVCNALLGVLPNQVDLLLDEVS